MTTETATQEVTQCDEQMNVVAEIFANMMHDAEIMIERQRRILQQQVDELTNASSNMIKDAMLNICASTGINKDDLKKSIAKKKQFLGEYGHANVQETEGGSQD